MNHIPLPIAIALFATSATTIFFAVKSWLAAKEKAASDLEHQFGDVYRHIDKVEEALDRRIADDMQGVWQNIDSINDRISAARHNKSK
jgi:septal ring factor EnvC (AmiA/AmiB activator)